MREKTEFLRVFVYGTLKPGESNYQRYCQKKVLEVKRAIALGKLFALPFGYPSMTPGESIVQGFLLSFPDAGVLRHLDWLEGYDFYGPAEQNEYNRREIETFNPAFVSLGTAWVYLMTPEQVHSYGGVLLPEGWWSGCGLSTTDSAQINKAN